MNRALWRYGRSDDPVQQAAVMVYVHRLMADGAPGEADPRALPPAGRRLFAAIERHAARFAGPYTVRAKLPERLVAGQPAELTVEVLTASGRRVPGVEVALTATGAGVPGKVNTGAGGVAKASLTAAAAGAVSVEARAIELPAEAPALDVPTVQAALYGPYRRATRSRARTRRCGRARSRSQATASTSPRRRAARCGLLHLSRVDRRRRGLRRRHDGLRRDDRDDVAKAVPKVTTVVSDAVVNPGGELFDRLTVSGLGKTPATVEVALYGPYASRADIDCAGTPYWTGQVQVAGDGEYASPKATVRRAGFYVFRERIAGSETVAAAQGECVVEAETSLAAPAILGGRGDAVAEVRLGARAAAAQGATGPSRVRLGRLPIDAPISAIGIDLKSGALGIPANIRRVGWWSDGAAPGDAAGTVLLALPSSIYTRSGPARLVLVTCGGPFDARSGHYRDNIVVTAVAA